jgi:hypothetical protein
MKQYNLGACSVGITNGSNLYRIPLRLHEMAVPVTVQNFINFSIGVQAIFRFDIRSLRSLNVDITRARIYYARL